MLLNRQCQGGARKDVYDVSMRRVEVGEDVDELVERVCETFGVKKEELSRRRSLSDVRLAAAVLLKGQSNLTGREIARRDWDWRMGQD